MQFFSAQRSRFNSVLNPKGRIKNKKNKSKQKTKNNKITSKKALKEHDIIDIRGRHDLAHEIYALASEKHILAHETLKPSKQKPKENTEKTLFAVIPSYVFFLLYFSLGPHCEQLLLGCHFSILLCWVPIIIAPPH
jgi:hypothetical protein